MDPNLTTAEAHRVFGEMYRKQRSPELQQKVDQIVAKTTDVFVRIKHIEELEEEEDRKNRQNQAPSKPQRRAPVRGAGAKKQVRPVAKKQEKSGGGLLSKLFGGEIARWGKDTGTIQTGFLGLNYRIDPRVEDLFEMNEEQVVASIQAFRYAITVGWEVWEPKRYNTVIGAYQFFSEFIKVSNIFRAQEHPNDRINATFKMQKFYGTLIRFPGYKRVITEELPALLRKSEKFGALINKLQPTVNFIATLDSRTPSLKNAILAHYTLERKKVENWEHIMQELKVGEPDTRRYRAPESIMQKIDLKISGLNQDYDSNKRAIIEVEDIKKSYFSYDSRGKIQVNFLDEVLRFIIPHLGSVKTMVNEGSVKAFKAEPHKLLYAVIRDLDLVGVQLLSGSISLHGTGAHAEEQLIFKQGLFKKYLEELSLVSRDIETFVKKNMNLSYSFSDFNHDIRNETEDIVTRTFMQIVKRANNLFRALGETLKQIVDNHRMAVESERSGHLSESVNRTKLLPIEALEISQRFIPFADQTIMSGNHLNDKTVGSSIEQMTMRMYNYLFIFRDVKLAKTLSSVPKMQTEMKEIQTQLEKYGVSVS